MSAERYQQIMQLWGRGERDAAVAQSAKLLSEEPGHEELAIFHSGLLLHQQAFETARKLLEDFSSDAAVSSRLLVNLSIARRGCGQLEGAVDAAKQAVDQAPELVSTWNALGIALIEIERLEEAELCLREGLSQHPDHAALLHQLDQVLRRQGKSAASEWDGGLALLIQADSLVKSGDPVAAESLLRQAVRMYPERSTAHASLGVFLMQFERNEEAARCFGAALERNPKCPTSNYLLQVVEGHVPESGSAGYVQLLFDSYAENFDEHLVKELQYRVPELLAEKIISAEPDRGLGEVLDLGCGTGLMAPLLMEYAAAIDGVDLSGKMLEKAKARGLYRLLAEADIRAYLGTSTSRWRVIVAADVFCYCGRLDDIFALAREHMEPEGVLAFSVESSADQDVEVQSVTGRYRHGREYLEKALAGAGFSQFTIDAAVLRKNSGQDVTGFLVVARP